jgi:serine protease
MPSGRVSSYTPNDEYWIYQGGVVNINCPQAWDYQKGSDSIIVAVIDSGVWASHPDLSGRIINGRDFINNTANSNDDYGHGTIMAGIIAATMDNSIGIAGVAHSRILALKAVDSQGYVYGNAVADALNYAANNGAKIISMSFGCTNIPALSQAINYAYSQGCLLVAATGNAGSAVIDYPAAYDQVIAVGALGVNNARWSLSNYGPQIDLVAYGEGILSTHIGPTHDTQYGVSSGTSDACAFVAGVAALVWSQNPTTLRDRIVTYLINSADDFGNPGFDNEYGNGRVNAYGAVTYGQMLVTGSDSLSGPGDSKGLMFDVPSPAIIHTILAGNENADFDIFLKWNSPASSTNYDVKSDSGYCFEHALTKGAGTLYVAIYSYSGSGNFKLWSLSGSPTDGSIIIGNVQQGQGSYSYGNGWGKGYAFTSGPDGCNFDLTIKWNALGMPWDCDAIGNTPAAQEYAGPVYGTGQLYGMTYSVSGNGDFVMMRAIY